MLESVNYPEDIKNLSIDELTLLAEDIRKFLIENVTRTGGHLSPNLGVVELTIALHYVFDAPKDDIIWDVGHQSYVHKILTGRKNCFDRLRMKNGLKGYPCPGESTYDPIHTGHSSTSLSLAAGMARAKLIDGVKTGTIAVIGDGSFTGGMAYEALNTISHDNLPVIIILNNNGMSISHNVGGITKYFKKLQTSRSYLRFKRNLETIMLNKVPAIGKPLVGLLYGLKEGLKSIVIRKNFFEDMGISYCGPIDGHNIKKLIETFREIKDINKSIIIHVVTTKGKGYKPSEDNPGHYHGISALAVNGDASIPIEKEEDSFSKVFGKTLVSLAAGDPGIYAITAAMKTGTGLSEFADKYPGRFSDVGIAEQHAVDYAVGLSLKGKKPVVAIYSTFLQRSFDQLVHDVSIANAKVLFCLDRSGLVPGDGETHQGIFDISYLRIIPHFMIMMPASKSEFIMMLEYALGNLNSPIAIRYPKDVAVDYPEYNPQNFPILPGEGVKVTNGTDALIVSTGTLLKEALKAEKICKKNHIGIEIINLRFAKPVSYNMIDYLSKGARPVLILEEGIKSGGVSEYLAYEILLRNRNKKTDLLTIPEEFPSVGTRKELLNQYHFNSGEIVKRIENLLK